MNNISRQKLRYIVNIYGHIICDDPKLCEALLRDLCPECKREINVLISALKENIVYDLLIHLDKTPKNILFERLANQLYENLGMAKEFAQWAVKSWAWALTALSEKKNNACIKIPVKPLNPLKVSPVSYLKLRGYSLTVSDQNAIKSFNLDNTWHPRQYIINDYIDNKDQTLTDKTTKLMWQKSGSGFKPFEQVWIYVKKLNDNKFAGYNDWRVPTIEELISILEPEKQFGKFYINPIFDTQQLWCWSSDKRMAGGAWSVHFGDGIVKWNFLECNIKAVRS